MPLRVRAWSRLASFASVARAALAATTIAVSVVSVVGVASAAPPPTAPSPSPSPSPSLGSGARSETGSAPLTKEQCIDTNAQAQSLRNAGKFSAARAALSSCSQASCPQLLRVDCTERLDALDRAQPSLVIEAKDDSGLDLANVTVFVDGVALTEKLGGAPLPIDPGEHDLRFETAGLDPVSRHLLIREGEGARREAVVFTRPGAERPASSQTVPVAPAPAGERPAGRGQRIAGVAVGGSGVVFVGLGAIFGGLASSTWNDATRTCNLTSCPASTRPSALDDRSAAKRDATLSTVGLIAGGALVAGGVVMYVTAPQNRKGEAISFGFAPTVGGGALVGRF